MKDSSFKFFHQLRLLLWKNFLIKKRSLLIVLFELTVPLVLFLIMLAIRVKQVARPIDTVYFNAWPLPSAGFVPLMQSFCKPQSGVKNANGFIEYPNSTALEMLQQIEVILKSNWSREFFKDSKSPAAKFQNNEPSANLNRLTDKLVETLVLGSTSRKNSDPTAFTLKSLINKNDNRLRRLLVDKASMPGYIYDELEQNATFNRDAAYSSYTEDSTSQNETVSFDKPHRTSFLHKLFCDKEKFDKIVELHVNKSAEDTAKDKRIMQRHLCNMTGEQVDELDSILMDQLVVNNPRAANSDDFKEIELRMKDYVLLLSALDDLAKLSIHLPTGLCTSKDPAEIERQSQAKRHTRPDAIINEKTVNGDVELKNKLKNSYGFIGLWYSMQKTFCGAGPDPVLTNNKTANNTDESPEQNEMLNEEQLKSLSLLFHLMYSNPMILYSPNTSVIHDNIIRKTNATFAMIDQMNTFCRQWLQTSGKLVDFINNEHTNRSMNTLNTLKQMSLSENNETSDLNTTFVISTTTATTTTTTKTTTREPATDTFNILKSGVLAQLPANTAQRDLLEKIDMIDSAACSWLSIMSGVNLNLFKGFANESDLVDYFLNKAYSDNVTVIASLVFQQPTQNKTVRGSKFL
jgi:ATP-binding cassette, subfamily A (ABC1), member 2